VTSWTAGAFLVLKSWGVGPGDEVIVPGMTFVSSANVVCHCGATPVFVDSERSTGNIDVDLVAAKITPRTKAIIPVHLYGHMVDMHALRELADRHGIKVLEDAAHCIEGTRDGLRPGVLGDAACFSFYATKNIASGEGGAIATNDVTLAEELMLYRLHGMSKSAADRYTARYQHWDMELLGYKANMFDIQAALLIPQLARIDAVRKRKEEICRRYERAFAAAGIEFPQVLPGAVSARHLFTIWAPRGRRDEMLGRLQERGIAVAVNFRAIHLLKYYREHHGGREGQLPVAEEIGDRTITIPLYSKLTDEEVDFVIDGVVRTHRELA
jgi:UDP-4-amino-4-deoxy-L-arabinose-oxoglutarate aminotransferase